MGMREANDNASGLKAHPLGSLETIAIIIGTNIGAGVLSMAYAARKVGYVPLLVCLALTCLFCIVTMLYVTEACLRTRGNNQLSGLSRRYLGPLGGWLIFIAVAANSYGALVAYMTGSGNIMLEFFGQYGLTRQVGSLIFFVPSALVLYLGLKALGVGEKLISAGMVAIVCILIGATLMHDDARLAHLWQSQWQYVVPVFNLAVFVFGAQFWFRSWCAATWQPRARAAPDRGRHAADLPAGGGHSCLGHRPGRPRQPQRGGDLELGTLPRPMGLLRGEHLRLAGDADLLLGTRRVPVHQYLRPLPPGQRNQPAQTPGGARRGLGPAVPAGLCGARRLRERAVLRRYLRRRTDGHHPHPPAQRGAAPRRPTAGIQLRLVCPSADTGADRLVFASSGVYAIASALGMLPASW